jgi:hypothetical protein
MGNRVQRVKTDVSEPQMAAAIIDGWQQLFGTKPVKEQVALILSQNSLETANRKAMWNYNVGNLTTDGKGPQDFFDDLATDEQTAPGVWKKMNLKYRAYPSLVDGVVDYLRLLSSKHYSDAWQHIINPDPVAFSKALHAGGYYTANEAPYTKSLKSLFNQTTNSNSYELAMSGQVPAPTGTTGTLPAGDVMSILNHYLQMVAASERSNKKLYKKYLPNNQLVIRVYANSYDNRVEFARILCGALDEELLADAFVHTDGEQVEVECSIHGPQYDCVEAVEQLTSAVAEAFQEATKKVGQITIKTQSLMNKKSSYQPISLKAALVQHKKFLLKFI